VIVQAQVSIQGSRAAVWAAIADIENAADIVNGIESIEVLERPASGLVGLKWRETRMLFGKPASAVKWVTEAVENEFYTTRAEEQGFVYTATLSLAEGPGGVTLTSAHDSLPQTFGARLMTLPMGLFFKGAIRKALLQDLDDIKAAVERQPVAA